MTKTLSMLMKCTSMLDKPSGIAVCVCGPIELAAEVREMVREVDGPDRSAVGGVELHEEYASCLYRIGFCSLRLTLYRVFGW